MPREAMKTLIRIAASCLILVIASRAEEPPAASPPPAKPAWSLVYLPSLDWTEAESRQTVELLRQVKPDLVVSMKACPFAESLRGLENKPVVLDSTQRGKAGTACGIPAVPLSAYTDTSTLHVFGSAEAAGSSLVWLSAESAKGGWNGPRVDDEELRALARMQIRKQFAERKGRVVFLVDPSVPTPKELEWRVPISDVQFEQTPSGIAGFTCIRPSTLRAVLPAVAGIAPRMPLIHWIRPGDSGVAWEILPIDGGPAIERKVSTYDTPQGDPGRGMISWLKAPVAPLDVPLWMDDYINRNRALGCGENIRPASGHRRFGWREAEVSRDTFDVLGAPDDSVVEPKTEVTTLSRGAVRSPGNLFAITVGQLDGKGMYPEEGDDGINVYLDDLHGKKSRLLDYEGLYGAWPSAATWFTDRYVITTGTGAWVDPPLDSDPGPRFHPLTIRLFDLVTGRTYTASGMKCDGQPVVPTERIFFPDGDYAHEMKWRALWGAVEASYLAKPEQAPVPAQEAAAKAKLSADAGLQWKDLGIWPPPETWRLVPKEEEPVHTFPREEVIETGDSYLTCKRVEGQFRYTLAIYGHPEQTQFVDNPPDTEFVARASLLNSGKGCLPEVGTVQRVGENKRFLLIAGNYQKPGTADSGTGKWMLLVDLLQHRSWSAHW